MSYLTNLQGPSQNNVRIGNALVEQIAYSKNLVPVSGDQTRKILGQDPIKIADFFRDMTGFSPADEQKNPVAKIPSGLSKQMTNAALNQWLEKSQMGTIYYADLIAADPEDNLYEAMFQSMMQSAKTKGGGTAFKNAMTEAGLNIIPESFWAYVKRKMNLMEEAAFKLWTFNQIDTMTPPQRAFWVQKIPEFKVALEKGKKRTMDILNLLADMRIHGVQSENDLKKLWLISMGGAEMPLSTVTLPVDDITQASIFGGGLFTGANAGYPVIGPSAAITNPRVGPQLPNASLVQANQIQKNDNMNVPLLY